MTKVIKVAVSPFYTGLGWKDEGTGVLFQKSSQLIAYTFASDSLDLSGIKKQVMLNNLILLDGDLDAAIEANAKAAEAAKKVEAVKEEKPAAPAPKKEVKEEVKKEVEEPVQEEKTEESEDLSELTVAELKEELEALEVEFDAKAKKAELVKLLEEAKK